MGFRKSDIAMPLRCFPVQPIDRRKSPSYSAEPAHRWFSDTPGSRPGIHESRTLDGSQNGGHIEDPRTPRESPRSLPPVGRWRAVAA
jgi:hypothetical protein